MRTTIGTAIRLAENVLLAGGRRQARLNAWSAVCENRRHAADREAARIGLPAHRPTRPRTHLG
ncbi:hypothetical protein [Kitasatospora sp. NBC_01266]|uniref:hypothetical protein n=1 Tax=Kitasatospora sp. NBC_01266 TaxID=2903572 RepID=UPI002E33B027|nr:hypothetical protein [Kitasatospora sp. NBC_01266]